jgi:hypothetical protein
MGRNGESVCRRKGRKAIITPYAVLSGRHEKPASPAIWTVFVWRRLGRGWRRRLSFQHPYHGNVLAGLPISAFFKSMKLIFIDLPEIGRALSHSAIAEDELAPAA